MNTLFGEYHHTSHKINDMSVGEIHLITKMDSTLVDIAKRDDVSMETLLLISIVRPHFMGILSKSSPNEDILNTLLDMGVDDKLIMKNPNAPISVVQRVVKSPSDAAEIFFYNRNHDIQLSMLRDLPHNKRIYSLRDFFSKVSWDSDLAEKILNEYGSGSTEEKIIVESIDKHSLHIFHDRENTDYVTSVLIQRSDDQDFINSHQNSKSSTILQSVISRTEDTDYIRRMWKEHGDKFSPSIAGRVLTPNDLLIDIATHTTRESTMKSLAQRCKDNPSLVKAMESNGNFKGVKFM